MQKCSFSPSQIERRQMGRSVFEHLEELFVVDDSDYLALHRLCLAYHKHLGKLLDANLLVAQALMQDQVGLLLRSKLAPLRQPLHLQVHLTQLHKGRYREPPGKGLVELLVQLEVLLVAKDQVDGQRLAGVLLEVVRVFEDVVVVLDLLRVGNEGDGGVAHDELIVLEDVADQANQLAAVAAEVRVELGVDVQQLEQLGQLELVAQQVEPSQPGELAVVEVDDLARELSLYLLQDELGVHELVGQQLYFPLVVAVGHVLVELTVDDDLLREEDALQLVQTHPPGCPVDLEHLLFRCLDHHHVVVVGEDVRIDEPYLLPAGKDEAHIVLILHLIGPDALEELLNARVELDSVILGGNVPL